MTADKGHSVKFELTADEVEVLHTLVCDRLAKEVYDERQWRSADPGYADLLKEMVNKLDALATKLAARYQVNGDI